MPDLGVTPQSLTAYHSSTACHRRHICLPFCRSSYSFYAQIESGTRKPNERIYELISTKYNVNKEWLLTGKGEMFSGPALDVELEQLIEIYKELDPLFREYIMLQIKQLLSVQKRGKEPESKKP